MVSAAAVTAVLPVAMLGGPGAPRLGFEPLPEADLGIGLSGLAWSPTASRQGAIITLHGILFDLAVGALAVGASPWQLRAGGLVEGLLMASGAMALGMPAGTVAARRALAAWPGTVSPGTISAPLSVVLGLGIVVLCGAGLILEFRDAARPDQRAARYGFLLRRLGEGAFDVVSLSSSGALVGLGTVDFVTTACGHCWQGGLAASLHAVAATLNAISPDSFRRDGSPCPQGARAG